MSAILETTKTDQDMDVLFTRQLLFDWMRKNAKEDGMNIYQSLWVFARFERFQMTMPWGTDHYDLFKLFHSGAVPTLYYCLCRVQADDMSESYHWLTQERIDWFKSRIADHISPTMANYLASLP